MKTLCVLRGPNQIPLLQCRDLGGHFSKLRLHQWLTVTHKRLYRFDVLMRGEVCGKMGSLPVVHGLVVLERRVIRFFQLYGNIVMRLSRDTRKTLIGSVLCLRLLLLLYILRLCRVSVGI